MESFCLCQMASEKFLLASNGGSELFVGVNYLLVSNGECEVFVGVKCLV